MSKLGRGHHWKPEGRSACDMGHMLVHCQSIRGGLAFALNANDEASVAVGMSRQQSAGGGHVRVNIFTRRTSGAGPVRVLQPVRAAD